MNRPATITVLAAVAALMMGADSPSCAREKPATPPPAHVMTVRGYAAPADGQIIVSLEGVAIGANGKPIQLGDQFPLEPTGVRNPFIQDLIYAPGVNITVTILVTAAEPNVVVGCEILDRGVSVSRDQMEIPVGGAATAVCGPYTTASM